MSVPNDPRARQVSPNRPIIIVEDILIIMKPFLIIFTPSGGIRKTPFGELNLNK